MKRGSLLLFDANFNSSFLKVTGGQKGTHTVKFTQFTYSEEDSATDATAGKRVLAIVCTSRGIGQGGNS